jgi:hypothetical protein
MGKEFEQYNQRQGKDNAPYHHSTMPGFFGIRHAPINLSPLTNGLCCMLFNEITPKINS